MTREGKRTKVGKIVPMSRQDYSRRRHSAPRRIPLIPFVPLNPGESRIKFVVRVSWDARGGARFTHPSAWRPPDVAPSWRVTSWV